MPHPRVFWNAYGAPPHELARTSRPSLHQLRDGAAFAEVMYGLHALGYAYEDVLLELLENAPESCYRHLTPTDLILRVTRPPLDDDKEGDSLRVQRSGTWLEQRVFEAVRPYFRVLSRAHVILSDALLPQLKEPDKANMEFYVHGSSDIHVYIQEDATGRKPPMQTTVAFALTTSPLWDGGPRLLAAWSSGGTDTLLFARYLRRHPEGAKLLKRLVDAEAGLFTMVEIQKTGDPPRRTVTLDFADAWTFRPLLVARRRSPDE